MADYSFLKPLFGADGSTALNFDQFSAALDAQKEIKVGNLADGSYVAKGKFDALVTERDTLKSSKEEADKKLAGYDPEWKTKADAAQAEADAKVNAILLKNAAMGALKDAGCKDPDLAFMALDASKLKLDGENVIGLNDQIEASKKAHPSLYDVEKDGKQTQQRGSFRVTTGSTGKAQPTGSDHEDLDRIYANNPFYKKNH